MSLSPVLNEKSARALTQRIRDSAEVLWSLLLKAHDGKAWKALGYGSWAAYVEGEFDMTKQRANQLIRHARFAGQLTEVTGVETTVSTLPEGATRTLTEDQRDEVVERVRSERIPPEQVEVIVRETVAKAQEDRQAIADLNARAPEGFDPRAEDARISVTHRFYEAVQTLAEMPSVDEVKALVPEYQRYRLKALPDALSWLEDFYEEWEVAS